MTQPLVPFRKPPTRHAPGTAAVGAESPDPGRRALLRALGAATAGMAVPAVAWGHDLPTRAAASTLAGAAAQSDLRVALLLPGSSFDGTSAAALSFRDGFTVALEATTGRRIPVQVHDIGGGVGRARAFARAQRTRRDTDVVVAMMSARAAPWMQQDLTAAGIPLVVASAGERVVRGDAVSPSFVHSSLELTRAAYASGRWAAEHGGRRCAVACSFYESGFDMVAAFRAGFEAAGGTIVLSLVSGAPYDGIDAAEAARELAESDADVIGAFYTGDDARTFFGAFGAIEGTGRRVVVGSPLVTAAEASGVAVTSVASWSPVLANDANRAFVALFTERFHRTPDPFAMLGYETACMMRGAAPGGARSLADGLRGGGFCGARGVVAMDARTNEISAPLRVRRIDARGGETLSDLAPAASVAPLAQVLPDQHGWITAYMNV